MVCADRQVVGLLSDLLHHPASSSYAEAWRSDTNLAAAPQLLLHLWEEEEDRLQVRETRWCLSVKRLHVISRLPQYTKA